MVGEVALSSSLDCVRQRVRRIIAGATVGQSFFANISTFFVDPLSFETFLGSGTASFSEFVATGYNVFSAPYVPTLSTGFISTDDIPISTVEKIGEVFTLVPVASSSRGSFNDLPEHNHVE